MKKKQIYVWIVILVALVIGIVIAMNRCSSSEGTPPEETTKKPSRLWYETTPDINDEGNNNGNIFDNSAEKWIYDIMEHWHEVEEDDQIKYKDRDFHDYGTGIKCQVCGYKVKESEGLEYELCEDGQAYRVIGIGSNMDEDLVIPQNYQGLPVREIGEKAFEGSDFLKSLTTLNGMEIIGKESFHYCKKIGRANIHAVSIEFWAFTNCSGMYKICLNEGLITIESQAFLYANISNLVFPESLEILGSKAFENNNNLRYVYFGKNIQKIGYSVFETASTVTSGELSKIEYNGTKAEWKAIEKEVKRGDPTNYNSRNYYWYSGINGYKNTYTLYCTDGRMTAEESR